MTEHHIEIRPVSPQHVSDALFKAVGQRPKSVNCPSGVEAKTGKTFRCTLTDSKGTKYGLTVTETSVSNNKVEMNIRVDQHPQ